MKLSKTSHEKLERFFQQHFEDKDFRLPQIHFYAGRFSRAFTKSIKVEGITFGRRIFILPALLRRNSKNQLSLPVDFVVHEIAHTLQYRREGFIPFLVKYVGNYYRNLGKKRDSFSKQKAYFDIQFEIEARLAADKFSEWDQSR